MLCTFRRHALAPARFLARKRAVQIKHGLLGTPRAHGICPPSHRHLSKMAASAYKYPGLNLPLRYLPPNDEGYAIHFPTPDYGGINPYFVREVAMMQVMEQLTDKQDWERKVFDQEIVDKWRKEALAIPDTHWWMQVSCWVTRLLAPESFRHL